jgi:hypothetical protein
MRYLTYFTAQDHRIDIRNGAFSGVEKIYYDGKLVSSKWSLFGSKHSFEIIEDNETVLYEVYFEYKMLSRIGFDIFRNGKALLIS